MNSYCPNRELAREQLPAEKIERSRRQVVGTGNTEITIESESETKSDLDSNNYTGGGSGELTSNAQQLPRSSETASSSTPPSLSRTSCSQKLTHPLHIFRTASLCPICIVERDARLTAFETHWHITHERGGDDLGRRVLTLSAQQGKRTFEGERERGKSSPMPAVLALGLKMGLNGSVSGGRGADNGEWEHGLSLKDGDSGYVTDGAPEKVKGTGWLEGADEAESRLPLKSPQCSPFHSTTDSPSTPRLSFVAVAGALGG